MRSQRDQRGGGQDEHTNNDAKHSCHRSRVWAVVGWFTCNDLHSKDTSFGGQVSGFFLAMSFWHNF
jgi:hypothetical protein